jgi:uncharacterized protein YndB with AHSA1/START domain
MNEATQLTEEPGVRREIEIEASPEEVWEAIATEEGRERWLEDEPGREIVVERPSAPGRIVWWWSDGPDGDPRRVELVVVAAPRGSRVIVTETAPSFPLTRLAASFALAVV